MPERVLVIEPASPGPGPVARLVQSAGHAVRHAAEAHEALELARGWAVAAILELPCDPTFGAELTAALRAEAPDLEVILVVADVMAAAVAERVNPSAWSVVARPFHGAQLMAGLHRALAQVRARHERLALLQRAQAAEKLAAVGRLTAGLSHEIRNPLNAASLQLAVVERRVARLDPEIQGSLLAPLRLVREEIVRLDHILQDFLAFARPVPVTAVRVRLRSVLERVAALLSSDGEHRAARLRVRCADELEVLGDANQLEQLVLNLTLNALDAAGPDGHVEVSARALKDRSDRVALHVDDDGPGVSPAIADRIFEPFFTTKARGSGLGLPMSASIADRHGGSLCVSRGPLGGARFTAELPARPTSTETPAAPGAERTGDRSTSAPQLQGTGG